LIKYDSPTLKNVPSGSAVKNEGGSSI
jgi:hypothetical protein